MSTTQILFNSPALHALKRDQLVKLCKIHSIKASGKNSELIEKLKKHALNLPPDGASHAIFASNTFGTSEENMEDTASPSWETGDEGNFSKMPRPSEQWEIVMDSIREVDEDSRSTLRSNRGEANSQAGEFGTAGSKSSVVTSSLKALATSLGLKRIAPNTTNIMKPSPDSQDELRNRSTRYSRLPETDPSNLPQTDHFTLSPDVPEAPIPGHALRPGLPAPANARLSTGEGITTTIRLVSASKPSNASLLVSPPKLQRFETAFDLIIGSPGGPTGGAEGGISVWPLSPGYDERQQLYPSIPKFDLNDQKAEAKDDDMDIDMPGGLSTPPRSLVTPSKPQSVNTRNNATPTWPQPSTDPEDVFSPTKRAAAPTENSKDSSSLAAPKPGPFVFGSPLPQNNISNKQFRSVAQSVLDEMNKRLAESGVESVDVNVLNKYQDGRKDAVAGPSMTAETKVHLRIGEFFDKVHQEEFDKMESIASHYAAKRGSPVKEAIKPLSRKRKSIVPKAQGGRPSVRSSGHGVRIAGVGTKHVVPGGFGDEGDEDEDEGNRRLSKRPRIDPAHAALDKDRETAHAGKKVSIAPLIDQEEQEKEERRKQREREAIKRKLEISRARRRSSMGRPSIGGKAPLPPQKSKGAGSRFGFLSSAKSIVQNVWNRGIGGSKAPATSIPVPKVHVQSIKEEVKEQPKAAAVKKTTVKGSPGSGSTGAIRDAQPGLTNRVVSGSSSNRLKAPSAGRTYQTQDVLGSSDKPIPSSSRPSRSPIPSFDTAKSNASGVSSQHRTATSSGMSTTAHSRKSSQANVSSLGIRQSSAAGPSRVSSVGTRTSLVGKSKASVGTKSTMSSAGTTKLSRTSSRLMAPTASSLAKTYSQSRLPVPSVSTAENSMVEKSPTLSTVSEQQSKRPFANSSNQNEKMVEGKCALDQITNSPNRLFSPRPEKIFSQPFSPSLIPSPVRNPVSFGAAASSIIDGTATACSSKPPVPIKPKVLLGRRPRISRSKVIAKLASQRAEEAVKQKTKGKTRSSIAASVASEARLSHGGGKSAAILSAKKRARQSEYARRKSRVLVPRNSAVVAGQASTSMDVDE